FGGNKAVEAAARPEIDNPLAGPQCGLREWVADPCKCFNGALRHSGHNSFVVAQASRQWASRILPCGSTATERYLDFTSSRNATASTGRPLLILSSFPGL